MKQFHSKFILRLNITIPKNSQIEKLDSSEHSCQSLDSTCDKCFVVNGILLYFNNYGKLYLWYILKRRYLFILKKSSVLLIECTEINWKTSGVNGLCIIFLLNNMVWYLSVIGKG